MLISNVNPCSQGRAGTTSMGVEGIMMDRSRFEPRSLAFGTHNNPLRPCSYLTAVKTYAIHFLHRVYLKWDYMENLFTYKFTRSAIFRQHASLASLTPHKSSLWWLPLRLCRSRFSIESLGMFREECLFWHFILYLMREKLGFKSEWIRKERGNFEATYSPTLMSCIKKSRTSYEET